MGNRSHFERALTSLCVLLEKMCAPASNESKFHPCLFIIFKGYPCAYFTASILNRGKEGGIKKGEYVSVYLNGELHRRVSVGCMVL